jgi:hypothetical protein
LAELVEAFPSLLICRQEGREPFDKLSQAGP